MSVNSVPHNLSLLNGTPSPPQTSVTNATPSQQLSSNGQTIQLDEPTMYIGSEPEHVSMSIEESGCLGAVGMPFFSDLHHLSPIDRQQSLHLKQPATISIGMNPRSSSVASKQVIMKGQSPTFHNVLHSSGMHLQHFSTERQVNEMKTLPHPNASMFLNLGSQQFQTKSKQTVYREMLQKGTSGMPVIMGCHRLPPTSKVTEQPEQVAKPKKAVSGNAGLQKSSSINKRAMQPAPSTKSPIESFELVRSKMRESLAASLALVYDEKSKSESEDKSPSGVDDGAMKLGDMCTQPGDANSSVTGSSCKILECRTENSNIDQNDSHKGNDFEEMKNSQQKISSSGDETNNGNFVVTDELLQGNGLCWVSDLNVDKDERRESHDSKRAKVSPEKASLIKESFYSENPQSLAEKIEAELFKLHGGVNKKYKEKGRSLLFNLKDRNNPELRKQVLSGDIAPQRLCSMTAEELASKELSDWRIAKAEELAQMVVLPDSEMDMRRVVKKTHKGEFQVEVEHDDIASVEVTFGATSFLHTSTKADVDEVQTQVKSNKRKAQMLSKSSGSDHPDGSSLNDKIDLVDGTFENKLTDIPNEKSDYMQDIIMEELKDEMLEQVPSLDEFMKDLDSEPPFKNLAVDVCDEKASDCLETKSNPDHCSLESKSNHVVDSRASDLKHESESSKSKVDLELAKSLEQEDSISKNPVVPAVFKSDEMDASHKGTENTLISNLVLKDSSSNSMSGDDIVEHIWEGLIQLNISSLVTVLGSYKSGEQTSIKDWPSLLEIKGRVRLDAFEKFLQELPLSRSRAVMIIQFCWKEGSPESGRVSLCETIDSYINDERVGYAEPAPGVEIYFCPPHEKIKQILVKQLSEEHEEVLVPTDTGFIGVVVWRRANVNPTISPRPSSSHHKHNSKKPSVSRKQKNTNTTNVASNSQAVDVSMHGNQLADEEPIDDAPPGFGPPASRDDDLPEFDYAQSSKKISASKLKPPSHAHHPPTRPVDQMRQLVHKYGQSESRSSTGLVGVKTWNEDEDDDIPEWQPLQDVRSHHHLPPQPPPPQVYHQQANAERKRLATLPPQPAEQQQQQQQQQQPMVNAIQQQLAPVPPPISMPLQPRLGIVPGAPNVHLGWQQQGQWWVPPTQVVNGVVQPYGYGGPLPTGGLPNASDWRRDEHR